MLNPRFKPGELFCVYRLKQMFVLMTLCTQNSVNLKHIEVTRDLNLCLILIIYTVSLIWLLWFWNCPALGLLSRHHTADSNPGGRHLGSTDDSAFLCPPHSLLPPTTFKKPVLTTTCGERDCYRIILQNHLHNKVATAIYWQKIGNYYALQVT